MVASAMLLAKIGGLVTSEPIPSTIWENQRFRLGHVDTTPRSKQSSGREKIALTRSIQRHTKTIYIYTYINIYIYVYIYIYMCINVYVHYIYILVYEYNQQICVTSGYSWHTQLPFQDGRMAGPAFCRRFFSPVRCVPK